MEAGWPEMVALEAEASRLLSRLVTPEAEASQPEMLATEAETTQQIGHCYYCYSIFAITMYY